MEIYDSTQLSVYKTDVAGVITLLVEGVSATTYSVSVASYPGTGSITYPASGGTPLATGEVITIIRELPIEQTLVLNNQGGYFPEDVEDALDKLTMIALQLQEQLDRAVLVPAGDDTDPADLIDDLVAASAAAVAAAALVAGVGLVQATETQIGIAEVATQAEVTTGSSDLQYITPLKHKTDLDNRIASQAEAEAGAVNTATDLMTPLRTAQAITALAPAAKVLGYRQTVYSGPVTSDGLPNFGGSTGSGTVTMSGTLLVNAANGFSASGNTDRFGSITNASWTGLTTNGTMYLYLDVAADGTCTTGSGTLAPTYRFGGADVVTNNQFTFNIQEMVGKVGNGSAATQTYRVYVGEVTVSGSVVTAITWYALMGRYVSAFVATLPAASSVTSFSHNIGTNEILALPVYEIECTTIDGTFEVGDRLTNPFSNANTGLVGPQFVVGPLTATLAAGGAGGFVTVIPESGGNAVSLTAASWKYRAMLNRGW
ncbi:MAG TPA: hypothetical protein DEP24_00885 [Mycobacterium sp.]|nr:hypothetical protein [Mycobacterium sp.]